MATLQELFEDYKETHCKVCKHKDNCNRRNKTVTC